MSYSPTLAVATAGFEIIVAAWAFTLFLGRQKNGRHLDRQQRWIAGTTGLILLLLAGYQLTEVAICANAASAGFLPRLAFIIVTWLPALGLLLVAQMYRPASRTRFLIAGGMVAAACGIVAWIALDRSFATVSVCNAVYARYAHVPQRFLWYGVYYWAGLFGMVAVSAHGLLKGRAGGSSHGLAHVNLGTLGFVIPSIAVSYFVPTTRHALPSVLCHFALILAIALTHMLWELRAQAVATAELTPSASDSKM